MIKTDVYLQGRPVGSANITSNGLYYNIHCRCKPQDDRFYRLMIACDGQVTDLGICVPFDDGFGMDVMIPIKTVGKGVLQMYLDTHRTTKEKRFIPLQQDKHFDGIESLLSAKFVTKESVAGLLITDSDIIRQLA